MTWTIYEVVNFKILVKFDDAYPSFFAISYLNYRVPWKENFRIYNWVMRLTVQIHHKCVDIMNQKSVSVKIAIDAAVVSQLSSFVCDLLALGLENETNLLNPLSDAAVFEHFSLKISFSSAFTEICFFWRDQSVKDGTFYNVNQLQNVSNHTWQSIFK